MHEKRKIKYFDLDDVLLTKLWYERFPFIGNVLYEDRRILHLLKVMGEQVDVSMKEVEEQNDE